MSHAAHSTSAKCTADSLGFSPIVGLSEANSVVCNTRMVHITRYRKLMHANPTTSPNCTLRVSSGVREMRDRCESADERLSAPSTRPTVLRAEPSVACDVRGSASDGVVSYPSVRRCVLARLMRSTAHRTAARRVTVASRWGIPSFWERTA